MGDPNKKPQPRTFVVGGRFEIKDPPIGQGGMGVVYKAYDSITRRYVALKTVWGYIDEAAIALFEKEWNVLARLCHPNIVDIIESGKFEEDGEVRPYFVMPLLPGVTLDQLIKSASDRLTVERTVEIIAQTCRGLQAAHDQGLIHRDLKPSNIFVMDDDSVKIIDFGVAHLSDVRTMTTVKGTLQYLAPELLEHKQPSPASDIFSLGVVCYEAFTGRKPFTRPTEDEVITAVLTHIPPPASELNSAVNQMLSRTVHKAMAKQPWHRFQSARDMGDTLKKAMRGEPIEHFDSSKLQARIDRIKRKQGEGDYQLGKDMLAELEAEGHIDLQISLLRMQLDQAIQQKSIRELLESARMRFEEEEYPLALQKVKEVLDLDPQNSDAKQLREEIDRCRGEKQVDNWYRLVRLHIDNQAFAQARSGLEEIVKVRPGDPRVTELRAQIDRQEKAAKKTRGERDALYQSALQSYQTGEMSTALDKLEKLLALSRQQAAAENPEKEAQYQTLYNQLRSEHDAYQAAYAEAKRLIDDHNFPAALTICSEYIAKNPGDARFQALKLQGEERERQERSAAVAEVGRRVEAEADLDRKIAILKDACEKYPTESHFKETWKLIRERRDLVNAIVSRARQYEERGLHNEALSQWDILHNIYPQYPGLDMEVQRLGRKREMQTRSDAKSRFVRQIDSLLEEGDYERSLQIVREGLEQFPGDGELAGLEQLANSKVALRAQAEELLAEGKRLYTEGEFENGLQHLRDAAGLDDRNDGIRSALLGALIHHAHALVNKEDWLRAKPIIEEALLIDGNHPVGRSLQVQIEDHDRHEFIDECVKQARGQQATGNLREALQTVTSGIQQHPGDTRLRQLQQTLANSLDSQTRTEVLPQPNRQKSAVEKEAVKPAVGLQTPPPTPRPETPGKPVAVVPPKPPASEDATRIAPVDVIGTPPGKPPKIVAPKGPPSSGPARKFGLSNMQWSGVGAGVLVLLAAIGFTLFKPHKTAPQPVQTAAVAVKLELKSNVPGTIFKVDGQDSPATQDVKGGVTHTVVASAEGYASATQEVPATASGAVPVSFNLQPAQSELKVVADLKNGSLVVGADPPVVLTGSEGKANLPQGETTIKVMEGARPVLTLPISSAPAKLITFNGKLLPTGDFSPVVVSILGRHARVYASVDLKGAQGTNPQVPIPADGVEVDLSAGRDFTFSNGQPIQIPESNTPLLMITLAGREKETLTVTADVPEAKVKVDNYPRGSVKGSMALRLTPGPHKIQLTADNYEDSEIRSVDVVKGKPQTLPFTMKQVNRRAVLSIEGAEPGAELFVDNSNTGKFVSENGSLRLELIEGDHNISLRKPEFVEAVQRRNFKSKETTTIKGSEFHMVRMGTVTFQVSPATARITYRGTFESADVARSAPMNKPISLTKGTYIWAIRADGYEPADGSVTIEDGKPVQIDRTLTRKPAGSEPVTKTVPPPKDQFVESEPWLADGDAWGLEEGKWGYLNPRSGRFTIAMSTEPKTNIFRRGKKVKYEFVIDYHGGKQKLAYTIEGSKFERREFQQNGPGKSVSLQMKSPAGPNFTLVLDVSKAQIVVRNAAGEVLDSFDRPYADADLGKIGFRGSISIRRR